MITITDKSKCCGCTACMQICPIQCIKMVEDKEGFKYPIVDTTKCIKCNKCIKVCPHLNPYEKKQSVIATYAFVSSDKKIRESSSSGGLFSELAKKTIESGGIVFGAVFDDEWNVKFSSTNNIDEIDKFRRSKYVQADINDTYKLAKQYLDENKFVLFCATPCQISGLNHFLQKDYKNLISVDFTCHSIPSPKVWRDYISIFKKKGIKSINFRNKITNGWNNYSLEIRGLDDNILLLQGNKENLYMRGFLEDLYTRPSCSNCVARSFSTKSDIMIGDFWDIENDHSEEVYNDNKGVSLCMTLTSKGDDFIKSLKKNITEVSFSEARVESSHRCIMFSSSQHRFRKIFYILYNKNYLRFLIFICIYPIKWLQKIYKTIKL